LVNGYRNREGEHGNGGNGHQFATAAQGQPEFAQIDLISSGNCSHAKIMAQVSRLLRLHRHLGRS
jgi:hypothetical protein